METYDWAFLLGQSLMPVLNAPCLGSVLHRSGLVPRVLPALGLLGAPLLPASDIAIFFGVYDRMAPVAALAALPIAVWELSLGVYLTIRGFRPSAVAALTAPPGTAPPVTMPSPTSGPVPLARPGDDAPRASRGDAR